MRFCCHIGIHHYGPFNHVRGEIQSNSIRTITLQTSTRQCRYCPKRAYYQRTIDNDNSYYTTDWIKKRKNNNKMFK
jgi:hypothetical protein